VQQQQFVALGVADVSGRAACRPTSKLISRTASGLNRISVFIWRHGAPRVIAPHNFTWAGGKLSDSIW
jgi:hypothetical protein